MVETLADRLIAAIAEPFHIDKAEIRIGVSIGCAFGPVDGQSVDDLIQKADLALYQAKAQGRGTCCFFNADMQNEAEDRLRLEQDMRIGIKAEAVPAALPAADQRRRPEPDRLRGADPLAPPDPRHRPAQQFHPARRGIGADHGIGRMGDRGGLPRRRRLARAYRRRDQRLGQAAHLSRRCPTRSTRRSANTGCSPTGSSSK